MNSERKHNMGFADLFKSTKEREREARRAKRQKERQVERVVDRIADRIKVQEKERAQLWAKAREMLQAGKKLDAQRLLQRYKGLEVLINRLERQQMLWRGKLNTIATAADANEAAAALAGFSEMLDIDPDRVVDDLERVEDAEGEIKEVNSVLDKAFEKDNEKIASESEKLGDVTVDEDLMAALESEAAAEIGGGLANASKTEDDINAGRDRLRALLEEK
jgi:hypothetical protein